MSKQYNAWWLSGKEYTCNGEDAGSIFESEDPLEKEMVIYTCILAWRIPRTEEPGWLQSMGSQESDNLAMQQSPPVNGINR